MKYFVYVTLFALASTILSGQQIRRNTPDLLARQASPSAPDDTQLANLVFQPATLFTTPDSEPPSAASGEALAFTSVIRPAEPKPVFHKKVFISELAAYTAANVLDGITTVRGVRRGFTESSWPRGSAELLGQRPGIGRYTAVMGALEIGAGFAAYHLQHSQNRYLRMVGHSFMMEGLVDHTMGFANNLNLPTHPPTQ